MGLEVGLVWVFDTIHQCLICHTGLYLSTRKGYATTDQSSVYFYLITNFNNPPVLADMIWFV